MGIGLVAVFLRTENLGAKNGEVNGAEMDFAHQPIIRSSSSALIQIKSNSHATAIYIYIVSSLNSRTPSVSAPYGVQP